VEMEELQKLSKKEMDATSFYKNNAKSGKFSIEYIKNISIADMQID
jgi:hypothetical protein